MKHSNSQNNSDARLPMLYPTPGKLHGSRKRRAYSSHGPHSVSNPGQNNSDNDGFEQLHTTKNETTVEAESSYILTPLTPNPSSRKSMETVLGTPVCDINSYKAYSPISNEMALFQHLSLRSPGRLSKSPGSSFTQYTKCDKTTGLLATGHSFDSSELSNTPVSHSLLHAPSLNTTNTTRMVPLTVLSDTTGNTTTSDNVNTVTSKYDCFSPRMHKPPLQSPASMIRPRPIRKSGFLPSPSVSSKDPLNPIAIVSHEKVPQDNMSSLETRFPDLDLSPLRPQNLCQQVSSKDPVSFSPPVSFVSIGQTNNQDNDNIVPQLKRKSSVGTKSMLKPDSHRSNEALNEMLRSADNDINGSLSDSEDGDAFFLETPSCLNLSSRHNSKEKNSENYGVSLSLCAAHLYQGKKKKIVDSRSKSSNGDQTSTNNVNVSNNIKSLQPNKSLSTDDNKEGTGSSTTSLFGMNIIHENSVSNGSLLELSVPFISRRNSSSKNLEDTTLPNTGAIFQRIQSDQSFSSIGLSIEDSALGCTFEYSKRDLITPPVNCRSMSSPPPLKIKLTGPAIDLSK